ncbi:MAG TPA: TolC family protein, partial [Gemmatimonadales bacterium]|nr:TolC family protein [Gemmatimonadales bacterium]
MIALLLGAQLAMAAPAIDIDSLPVVTLDEALSRSVRLNPDYVRALSTVAEADWIRKTARVAFFIPAVSATLDYTKYSQAFFNIGTFNQSSTASTFQLTASYELLSARKFTELGRTAAQLENAQATEAQHRYAAALLTESAYYAVISDAEFAQVERDRVARAEAQLALARARVATGAAVQSDSLTVVLELVRARSSLLSRESQLRVSRLELGRRVGTDGPVDAAPLDTLVPARLPLGLPEAVMQALQQGPEYRAARSAERAADVALSGRRGAYLPILTLTAAHARFDEHIFPSASNVSSITITASLPLWDNGQRELAI